MFGIATGRKHLGDKETWWWDDKGQMVIKAKKEAANKAVATTKALAMNELYEELETPEGERKIFRIAKARDKATKDLSHMKQRTNMVWF